MYSLSRHNIISPIFPPLYLTTLSFRHALRWFLESLETWKDLDRARLVRSLDAPYAECYALCVSLRETENNLSLSIASLDHDNHNDHGTNNQPQDDGNGVGGGDLLSVRAMLSQAEQRCERMREAMRQLVRQSNHGSTATSSSKRVQPSTTTTTATAHSQPPPLHPQSQSSFQSQSSSLQHQVSSELLQLQSRWEEIHAQIHAAHAAANASSSATAQSSNPPLDIARASADAVSLIPRSSLLPAVSPLSLHPHLLALLHGPSPVAVTVPANHLLTVRRTLDRLTALGALPPAPDGWSESLLDPSVDVVSLSEPLFAVGDLRHQLLHALLVDPSHRLPPARRSQNLLFV